MSKTVKFGIIFFALLIVLIILNTVMSGSSQDRIKSYLISMGYIEESDDETRLFKLSDNTTIDYFSIAEYTLTRNINDQNDSFKYSLSMKYDYKNHELIYNYHTTYSNNINVIFKGSYINDDYVCDKEFSTASLTSSEINNVCSLIKIKVESFYKETQILFNNYRLIEYMENAKIEEEYTEKNIDED